MKEFFSGVIVLTVIIAVAAGFISLAANKEKHNTTVISEQLVTAHKLLLDNGAEVPTTDHIYVCGGRHTGYECEFTTKREYMDMLKDL